MELMGVFDEALVEPLAPGYGEAWRQKSMVVYGQDKWMRFPCAHLHLYVRLRMDGSSPMRLYRNNLDTPDAVKRNCREARGGKCGDYKSNFKWRRKRSEASGGMLKCRGVPLYHRKGGDDRRGSQNGRTVD